MIIIKNKTALLKMSKAGALLAEVFEALKSFIKPGLSSLEIDRWIEKQLNDRGLTPRAKGYSGYKHVSCVSVNDALIHGVPKAEVILQPGDLVKIDVIASWKGYCADMARSFLVVGGDELEAKKIRAFVAVAQRALDKGIAKARAGNHISDISAEIQREVELSGFGVVVDFAGHGIGKQVHEEPEIPNFGEPGKGPKLRLGMTLAIEPMITMGNYKVCTMNDGWTVRTCDKSLAAHVEDTIVVTEGAAKILTRPNSVGGNKA